MGLRHLIQQARLWFPVDGNRRFGHACPDVVLNQPLRLLREIVFSSFFY